MDFRRELFALMSFVLGFGLVFSICFVLYAPSKTDKIENTPTPTVVQESDDKKPITDYKYVYTLENDGVVITQYIGKETEAIIPSEIDGKKVTLIAGGISGGAFYGQTSLTSITIPENVTMIGDQAFMGCTSLTSIIIPASVTVIYGEAFISCSSLKSVYFEGNAPKVKGVGYDWSHNTVSRKAEETFYGAADDFKIYYKKGTSGWTNPWYGYPTEEY